MQKQFALLWILPLMVLALAVSGTQGNAAETGAPGQYLGADACKDCHETEYGTYLKSVHSKPHVQGPATREACETCHGGGAKHAEKGGGRGVSIFGFGKQADANARTSQCLSCHDETKPLAFWDLSSHKTAGVACNDCHAIHSDEKMTLKKAQPELCFDCHRDIRSQANRQSHHPLEEGKVSCSDCHDVHGAFGAKMIKADSVNDLCYTCHAEKRGPFRFEHQPVAENCLNCHNSHGSNHRAMLVSKAPQLCQDCHGSGAHNGAAYTRQTTFNGADPQIQMYGRACMNCHTNIHGSSADWLK